MLSEIKRLLYFPVAYYFRFFASIRLRKWNPRVVVVTGSSGKTTLLHFIESQLKQDARYSHHANSAFGICFDLLGLHRETLLLREWPSLFLAAPFAAFKKPNTEKIYVVEADCDRPGEGFFLASLLTPEVTLWISSGRTHGMNFEQLAAKEKKDVRDVIAKEFSEFARFSTHVVIANGDNPRIVQYLEPLQVPTRLITKKKDLDSYEIKQKSTVFEIRGKKYETPVLLVKETFYAIVMTNELLKYLGVEGYHSFSRFRLPPGRSSVFRGIKGTTLIDSTYNSNLDSATAVLRMFKRYPGEEKWLVIGDMLEQGQGEREEHEALAGVIAEVRAVRVILLGPRTLKYTLPQLQQTGKKDAQYAAYLSPKEVLDDLQAHLKGGEVVLFKGARFLEGVIENLLADKTDVARLPRREKIWEIQRKRWGL